MIKEYTPAQEAEVKAIPDPKHIWYDLDRIVVYTGDDLIKNSDVIKPIV